MVLFDVVLYEYIGLVCYCVYNVLGKNVLLIMVLLIFVMC